MFRDCYVEDAKTIYNSYCINGSTFVSIGVIKGNHFAEDPKNTIYIREYINKFVIQTTVSQKPIIIYSSHNFENKEFISCSDMEVADDDK